ncbi:hypothetical protein [Leuconostoc mesenteroides]|uniref:hypothetical protein n=1 Tax=Leuconostoc mesenteroides TaxID=1245 RepID=UPI00235F2C2C|nr:hypothetical protein [Leuconostoc mesenteroides]
MSEPVAYLAKSRKSGAVNATVKEWSYHDFENIPLYTKEQLQPKVQMTQAEFDELEISLINAQFDYSELKKTIEIIPDMKWFVRTKEFDDGVYKVLEDIRLDYYEYGNVENDEETAEYGHRFDTKEEADLWTNPLTEAVQLPVEGK